MAHVPLVALVMLWPQESVPVPSPDFVSTDISQIYFPPDFSDYTADRPSDCEVHGIRMKTEIVPVAYGLLAEIANPSAYPSEPTMKTRRKLFPHAESFVWGGCCRPPDWMTGASKARIWICSDCVAAETEWRKGYSKQVE